MVTSRQQRTSIHVKSTIFVKANTKLAQEHMLVNSIIDALIHKTTNSTGVRKRFMQFPCSCDTL